MDENPANNDAPDAWYRRKTSIMESILGKEHNVVMHALIGFGIGGALDLYFYGAGVPGTAIATKELSDSPEAGSSNNVFRRYELVMFTRHRLPPNLTIEEGTPFGKAHATIRSILNPIAVYSQQATLNPNETCEFPLDMPQVGGKCLIFDAYGPPCDASPRDFGLLAVIEIFRSEMNFARKYGGAALIARLKEHHHYPYSDLDRKPVA